MDLTGKKFWVALTGKPAVINPLWDLGRLRRFPSGSEPQRGAAVAAAGSGPQAGAVRGPRRGRAQAAWAAGVAPPLAPEPLAGRFSGFAKYKRFLRAQRKPLAVSQKMDLAAARGGLSPFGWKTAPRREKPENRPGAASPRRPPSPPPRAAESERLGRELLTHAYYIRMRACAHTHARILS